MLISEYRYFKVGKRITISPMGRSIAGPERWCEVDNIVLRTRHERDVFPYPIARIEDLFDGAKPLWFRVTHGFRNSGKSNPAALPAILHDRRISSQKQRYTFCVEMTFDDLMTLHLSV